jgi:cell division protein FtsW
MGLTLLILSFGFVTLYSASSVHALRQDYPDTYYVLRQATGAGFGLVLLFLCALTPYRVWASLAWPLLVGTAVALLLLVLPWTESIAPEIKGSRRWLIFAGATVQPSEVAKIAVVVWTAAIAVRKIEHFQSLRRGLGPFFAVWGLVLLLIALEPDLSTAMVVGLLGTIVVFAAGARVAHFVFLAVLVAPVLSSQLAVGFRAERIQAFLDPLADPSGAGFQVRQSLLALGSGGVSGVGIGEGRQRFGFLPEAHNDFIFAMIGEEWGLVGVVVLVTLYVAVVLVGFRIASLIAVQAILHMAVGLALAPTTGLALPLVSYGRSNLVITLVALGIVMSIARATPGGKAARA